MTHNIFSQQQLQSKTLPQLRQTYAEIGCTVLVQDKRRRDEWINAIASYQSTQIQKVAQAELNNHLLDQAQIVAPELTTVKINDRHFEVYADKWLVAYITYDYADFVTQPWVVMVNGEVIFRHNTQAQCYRFISWHYKDKTLNPQPEKEIPEVPFISEVCFYDQEALVGGELVASINYNHDNHQNPYWCVFVNDMEIFRDTTPARCHSYVKQQYQAGLLPVQEPFEEPCDNRTMAYIFDECQQYGLEVQDDGIYRDGERLGQVGFTNGNWWVSRGNSSHRQYSDSVFDAVRSLNQFAIRNSQFAIEITTNGFVDDYWQYRPLEQLNSQELQQLFEQAELVA